MPDPGQLSVNDRVLLHLSRYATDVLLEEYPAELTQAGIALAVGISRTHVPRAVKGLIKEGLAAEQPARVKGHERRMSVYLVTTEGLRRTEELWSGLLDTSFTVMTGGKASNMTGREIEELAGRRRAIAAISQMKNGFVEIDKGRRAPVRDLSSAPVCDRFCGREAELAAMDAFMESDARVLVILGNKGYGTSALARKFVDGQEESDVLWVPLSPDTSVDELDGALTAFGRKVNGGVKTRDDALALGNALLVFDDYFSVPEEVVEYFSDLVESVKDAKVIMTAREETPAYNWFYQKKHVDTRVISELRIKGLDQESARKLIGNDRMEKDALRRIMMLTRGQPLVLTMLRDKDEKGLRKDSVFTVEEIRYLLFLRDKTE